jgi:2-dehydro-3-deoxygalactonokinase
MTALIGLDWGSSSLRAMRLGADGEILEQRNSGQGASTLHGGPSAFVAALDELISDWHELDAPILACGMVGSQHGWREVPYAEAPADAAALRAAALDVDWRGRAISLLPGLRCKNGRGVPDLMRGEETQVIGALQLRPELAARSLFVLPGTHSKWAAVREGRVQSFATQMSGEVYALLRQHSVLGRLMPASSVDHAGGFAAGVAAARDAGETGLLHQLFSVRTLGLSTQLPPEALPDYLSGLLIGHELRAGLAWRQSAGLAGTPLQLVGEPVLCERYARALVQCGQTCLPPLPNTAAAGLWALARIATLETR